MKVLDLQCERDHVFEGWFADEQTFHQQRTDGVLECPVCGTAEVRKLLSAPRLNLGAFRPGDSPDERTLLASNSEAAIASFPNVAGHLLKQARAWVASTENVGERFTAEARAMHDGELPERPIRGVATAQQAQELRDEGIGVLGVPPFLCEPHH